MSDTNDDIQADILDRAKAFALKRHSLYFQREKNLTVGMNFVGSMADLAAQESAAAVKKREAEIIEALDSQYRALLDFITKTSR